MFIGHFSLGLAAKRVAPETNLGVLVGAAQLADLVWPVLLLAGVEQVEIQPGNTALTPLAFTYYPFTHSLVAAVLWALGAGLLYGAITKYRTGAVVVGILVASHWFLDALVHRPDLPLYPGAATVVGMGLWNSIPLTVALEGLMFAAAAVLYVTGTRPRGRAAQVNLWAFLAVLVAIYVANVRGAPPPSARAVAWVGLAVWAFPIWAGWIDGRRNPATSKGIAH